MRFLKSLQQDAKLFLYIYILLMAFRIAFLLIYSGQLGSARAEDVAESSLAGSSDQSEDDGVPCGVSVCVRHGAVCRLGQVAGGAHPGGTGQCGCGADDTALCHPHSLL